VDKVFLSILTLMTITACADPKYAPQTPSAAPSSVPWTTCYGKFSSGECVFYEWEKFPTGDDFGTFLFKVGRPNLADGTPIVTDLDVIPSVLLFMPAMGHGSSPVTVERLDVGTYRASQVFFSMKGLWEIHFQLKDGNKIKDQVVVPITL
jgi:hypothetical protein